MYFRSRNLTHSHRNHLPGRDSFVVDLRSLERHCHCRAIAIEGMLATGAKDCRVLHPSLLLAQSFLPLQDARLRAREARVRFDIVALEVLGLALSIPDHNLRQVLTEGLVMALYRNPQVQMEDLATVVYHSRRVQKVGLERGDDHSLVLRDFSHNLRGQELHTGRDDLVVDIRSRSRILEGVALGLVSNPLSLGPWEYLLLDSHPGLSLDLAHKVHLLVLPLYILSVGRILPVPSPERLGSSCSHRSTDFVVLAVLSDLFLYQQEALDRRRSKVVTDCHIHLWGCCSPHDRHESLRVLLFVPLVAHRTWQTRHLSTLLYCPVHLAMSYQMVFCCSAVSDRRH